MMRQENLPGRQNRSKAATTPVSAPCRLYDFSAANATVDSYLGRRLLSPCLIGNSAVQEIIHASR